MSSLEILQKPVHFTTTVIHYVKLVTLKSLCKYTLNHTSVNSPSTLIPQELASIPYFDVLATIKHEPAVTYGTTYSSAWFTVFFNNALSMGGRTPTASRQASRHETKDAVLLHS
jgi:hypothetical protein